MSTKDNKIEELEHENNELRRKFKRADRARLLQLAENMRLRRMIQLLMEEREK